MLVIMRRDSTPQDCSAVEDAIRSMGFTPLPVPGQNRTAICVTGNQGPVEPGRLARLPGVLECIRVTRGDVEQCIRTGPGSDRRDGKTELRRDRERLRTDRTGRPEDDELLHPR